MKKITLIETLVLLAIAVPAFAAYTCTGRECTDTVTEIKNVTRSIDSLVAEKQYLRQRRSELNTEIDRDRGVYITAPQSVRDVMQTRIAAINAELAILKAAGANVTAEDES